MDDREIDYLDLADILNIHDFIMERTGYSSAPLRSQEGLEGAIARPRNAAAYSGVPLLSLGCLLMVAVAEAQAFVDGNKRTGMAAGLYFLERNGLFFNGDADILAVLLEEAPDAPDQQAALATLTAWMQVHVYDGNTRPVR